MTLQGKVVKSFTATQSAKDFVSCTVSPRGDWIYCAGDDKALYCFSVIKGTLEHMMKVHDGDVLGMCHHPHRNLLATFSEDGAMNTWKP